MNDSQRKLECTPRTPRRATGTRLMRLVPFACLAVGLCSCIATPTMPPGAPGMKDSVQYDRARRTGVNSDSALQARQDGGKPVAQAGAAAAVKRPDSVVQTASHTAPAVIRVKDAAPVAEAKPSITFTPARPRDISPIQLAGHQQPAGGAGGLNSLAMLYPDEYLFDGGDRAKPIHYDRFHRLGLDTEDTVVEYSDNKGKRHVKPSNRVAVYAPRFAAVRTVSNPMTGVAVDKASGAQLTTHGAGLLARTATILHVKGDQADGVRMRSRASGLNGDAVRITLKQSTALKLHDKLNNLFENLAFVKTGRLNSSEEARLAARIQAATVWSRDRFPIILGGLDAVKEVESTSARKVLVGVDDSHKRDGKLRIVKLADKKAAAPGDVITFTIRYDNLGDRPVKNIRIVDNLTARLEYIDDSATSSLPGRLDVEDNNEGSLVLKFVLDNPLPGKAGGFVTFKAKVK